MKAEFLCPVITVYDENGNVDFAGNEKVYGYLVEKGVDGIVLLGSSGEFFHLTLKEKQKLIDLAAKIVRGRAKLYVGTGGMDIKETITLSEYALKAGADGVMVISPYYFDLSDESVEHYYDMVAENVDGPVLLYNFPAHTGYDLKPEIAARLADKHENVVGYKDSVPDVAHTRKLIDLIVPSHPEFAVYSGFDENFLHNIIAGGAGSIGGLSNLVPEICAAWVKAVNECNWEEAKKKQKYIDGLMGLYDISVPFMPAIRYAMNLRGLHINECCREPFLQVNEEQKKKIAEILEKAKLI